jgi:hypothetical protein
VRNALVLQPWHDRSDPTVFHVNAGCSAERKVALSQRRAGDGGRRLCPECEALNNASLLNEVAGGAHSR